MGTITISLNNETEHKLRELAEKTFGKRKGYLGEAVTEAIEKWAGEKQQKEIAERELKVLEKGYFLGKRLYKDRGELHERSWQKNLRR